MALAVLMALSIYPVYLFVRAPGPLGRTDRICRVCVLVADPKAGELRLPRNCLRRPTDCVDYFLHRPEPVCNCCRALRDLAGDSRGHGIHGGASVEASNYPVRRRNQAILMGRLVLSFGAAAAPVTVCAARSSHSCQQAPE